MVGVICNIQSQHYSSETQLEHQEYNCEACGVSVDELEQAGKSLETCGTEHYSDPVSGERFMIPAVLCPKCHLENNCEANDRLNPCHPTAARSWVEMVEA